MGAVQWKYLDVQRSRDHYSWCFQVFSFAGSSVTLFFWNPSPRACSAHHVKLNGFMCLWTRLSANQKLTWSDWSDRCAFLSYNFFFLIYHLSFKTLLNVQTWCIRLVNTLRLTYHTKWVVIFVNIVIKKNTCWSRYFKFFSFAIFATLFESSGLFLMFSITFQCSWLQKTLCCETMLDFQITSVTGFSIMNLKFCDIE